MSGWSAEVLISGRLRCCNLCFSPITRPRERRDRVREIRDARERKIGNVDRSVMNHPGAIPETGGPDRSGRQLQKRDHTVLADKIVEFRRARCLAEAFAGSVRFSLIDISSERIAERADRIAIRFAEDVRAWITPRFGRSSSVGRVIRS